MDEDIHILFKTVYILKFCMRNILQQNFKLGYRLEHGLGYHLLLGIVAILSCHIIFIVR